MREDTTVSEAPSEGGRPATGAPRERYVPVLRNPFVWAFLLGILTLTLMRPLLRREPAPPPVLGQLPEYRLVAADGQPFGSAELAGDVYVANFIFTRCGSICPALTAAMHRLQQRYDAAGVDGVRLVSITVDPQYDSPEVLRRYGEAHGVDPGRWNLLTGESEQIRALVVDGFKTALGPPPEGTEPIDIAHSGKFVLVDGAGRIRGYYDSDDLGLDEIFHRSRHVLKQEAGRLLE